MQGMMLHCGASAATRDEVFDAATPDATETHYPLPHGALIEVIEKHVQRSGFEIATEEYGLWKDGARMFGVWGLTTGNGVEHSDFQLVMGVRNSHDKAFSAGLAVGSRVFVCDNLAFSSEIVIARKHTRFIARDLDRMVAEAAGKIAQARISQAQRIEAYKGTELEDAQVHDLLIRAVDAKVMANSYIAKVLEQWRESEHEEFQARTAWSLFNGFTQVFKETNPLDLTGRSVRLHGLLDMVTDAFGVEGGTPDFGEGLRTLAGIEEVEAVEVAAEPGTAVAQFDHQRIGL